MPILVDKNTRVIVQGLTGTQGQAHARRMMEYGTKIVAGVTPGKGGETCLDVPVFETMDEAVAATEANTSIVFVPAVHATDAILEAAESGIELVVCISKGIPVQDVLKLKGALQVYGTTLIGPNSPGVMTPGVSLVGIMPADIFLKGNIGIVSRSGTLTYEAVRQTTAVGLGQSTVVGIGGDELQGLSFVDCLRMFEDDRKTKGIIIVGEIGGSAEEEAAEYIRRRVKKPVVAYVAGVTAPPEKRMGHAGAIISGGRGTAKEKFAAFESANVVVVRSPADMGVRMLEFFEG